MEPPFTIEEFLNVFITYNTAIWPAQVALNAAGLVAIALCFRKSVPSRLITAILGILWLWTGAVYQLGFFQSINPVATPFGILCIVQGGIFLGAGVWGSGLSFQFTPGWRTYVGGALLLYGLVIYPILGYFLGHRYPASPTFGAPCPTTIFTFGILLWTSRHVKWFFYLLPLIWSMIGFTAALNFGVREDIGLLVAGITGAILLVTYRSAEPREMER